MEMIGKAMCITKEMIKEWHDLTGGTNPIHIDTKLAMRQGFKGPVAHGDLLFILALETFCNTYLNLTQNAVEMDAKFIRPVCAGDTIEIWIELANKEKVKNFEIRVDGRPAVVGKILNCSIDDMF